MDGTEEASGFGVRPDQPDIADIEDAAGTKPTVVINNSQGIQVVLGGEGTQTNRFGGGTTAQASPDEFRADVLELLTAVDDSARTANLPPYLRTGSDVMQMARTVRLLGRVRRPEDETEADLGYGTGRAGYTAGAERQTVKSAVSNRRPPEGKSRQRHQHGALGLGQFRRPIPGVIVPAR